MPVEFNEPPVMTRTQPKRVSLITKFILSTKIVKTELGARVILVTVLTFTLILIWFLISSAMVEPPTPHASEVIP